MIVVKIEIWPGGDESKAREHCRAKIWNDMDASAKTKGANGSYRAEFMQNEKFSPTKIWKRGHCPSISRTARGVWDILFVCLFSAGLDKRNADLLGKAIEDSVDRKTVK